MIFYYGFSMTVLIIYILIFNSQIASVFGDSSGFNFNGNDCNDRIIKCLASDKGITPVCGTDGITYSSYCQVLSKQCDGVSIFVDYLGACEETSQCLLAQRRYPALLKPRCNRDGTFSSIQCYLPSGYCWCATPEGHQIPHTLTHYEKPNCSLSRLALLSLISSFVKCQPCDRRQRSDCSPENLLEFIETIRIISEIEFSPLGLHNSESLTLKSVVWKFYSLDVNRDGFLSMKELQDLVTIVEEILPVKNCASSFGKKCDLDMDIMLSFGEWYICLTNRTRISKLATPLLFDDDDMNDPQDCFTRRQNALNYQQKTSQENIFIPECKSDGRYEDVQCYSGVCWCVDPNNGLSLPRTFVKGTRPNCGKNIAGMKRRIKGCSERKQKELINEMMALFKNKSHGANFNCLRRLERQIEVAYTAEVHIAAVMFCLIDRNNNGVLQRGREWKAIRMIVPSNRCAKKFPRFCDVDEDFEINFGEWLGCLNVKMTNDKMPGRDFNSRSFFYSD